MVVAGEYLIECPETAFGVQAIEHHHYRMRFFRTIELMNALEAEKTFGNPGHMAHRLTYHCHIAGTGNDSYRQNSVQLNTRPARRRDRFAA